MRGSSFNQANLSYADLSHADLRDSNIERADFTGIIFEGTRVDSEYWIDELEKKGVIGINYIREKYEIKKINSMFRIYPKKQTHE